jgi:segregation and condensation protein A
MTIAADDVDRVDEVEEAAPNGFAVHLDNFEGPFDLLLQLIARHQLDITDIALSKVTDEFIAHLKAMGDDWELDQTSQFLVIASTLLDLKVVRLLPSADLEDEEDLALLEARDLLFARLMQYRAFKQVAAVFEERLAIEARRHPRAVGLDERYTSALPDVLITLSLDEFAALAARALEPRPEPVLGLTHLHVPRVSVREQAAILVDRLRRHQTMTFRALVADSPDTLTTVGRFLALLELFRENAVAFEQVTPLGDLNIRWTGLGDGEIDIADEYDEHAEADQADISAEAEEAAAEASDAQSETRDSETADPEDTVLPDVGPAAETEDEETR